MAVTHDKRQLCAESFREFHRYVPIAVIASLVNSIFLIFILRSTIAHSTLAIWFGSMVFISLLRYLFLYKYRRLSPDEAKRWNVMNILGVALSGMVWGSAGIFLFPANSIAHQVFLVFILGGMVAGSAGTLSIIMKAFFAYSLPSLIPIIVKFFIANDEIHIVMGIVLAFFWLMMYSTAKRVNASSTAVLKLNFSLAKARDEAEEANAKLQKHREHLADMVKERTDELKTANTKLQMEIVERRRTEEDRVRLMTAIEHADETIMIADLEGQIQYANSALTRTSGYTIEEAIGRDFCFMKSEKCDELFYQEINQAISTGKSWRGRLISKKKDGSLFYEDASVSPAYNESGEIVNYVAVKRDITREVELESQLVQAEKMRAMGVLAGGIAHDFNNILTPIIGYAEIAIDDAPNDSAVYENIREVLKAAQRAKDLVQQILAFARKTDEERKPMKLQLVVKDALNLLKASLPSTIEIRQNLKKERGSVLANPTQMHQIVMNLCTNAYHAMRETGGILEVNLAQEFCEWYQTAMGSQSIGFTS